MINPIFEQGYEYLKQNTARFIQIPITYKKNKITLADKMVPVNPTYVHWIT